ncbi:MAG: Glu-tRNA(Gln) amidotransferase GatDE subunit D, partial [Halodesulfurarchaeum sp.]|nr:Glu-tRNA(Gln) amidotransferase GatDE subunit D [Halodesulfurarchaeum sp.]
MNPGDRVRVERAGERHEGIVMPSSTADHVVLKLESGYNVGVDRDEATVEILETDVYDIEEGETSATSTVTFDPD